MAGSRGAIGGILIAALLAGLGGFALADAKRDLNARKRMAAEDRLTILEHEVSYLRAREQRLSGYMLANGARADGLTKLASLVRAQGFTQRAMPAQSRETLIRGLETLAVSMKNDLPLETKEEAALLAATNKLFGARPAKAPGK